MPGHAPESPAPAAGHGHLASRQRRRAVDRHHVDHLHLAGVDAQMFQRAQQLVVGDRAEGNGDLLALQGLGIGLVDGRLVVDHAVVVLGVGDGHAHRLQRGALGDRDGEGNGTHGIGDLHLARHHRLRHGRAGFEGAPVQLDAHLLVVPLFGLRDLVRRRPLREVGDGDLRGRLRGGTAQGRNHGRRRRHDGCE